MFDHRTECPTSKKCYPFPDVRLLVIDYYFRGIDNFLCSSKLRLVDKSKCHINLLSFIRR